MTSEQQEHGVVHFWDHDKGWGFIKSDSGGRQVFSHINDWLDGQPAKGVRVRFTRVQQRKGPRASDVREETIDEKNVVAEDQ